MGDRIAALVEAQRPQLALWIPVFYALGVAGYFALPFEPSGWLPIALGAALAAATAALFRVGPLARVLLLALLLPGLGFTAATLRARAVAAPVLPREMTANVEGRVVGLDRSASERPRVLLDRVVIHGLEPGDTPARVRVSLDPATPWAALEPGMRLLGQARLSPPSAPVEPGGFDFRRLAWFERLGAVGYARTPFLETTGNDDSGFRQLTFRLRMALSAHIARPVLAVFITSLVAGVATAPYSAFHFNVLGQYGLLANLLAMPAMGLVVMPAAVLAMFLAPVGLDWLAFTVMGWGIGYVLAVAGWVAGLGGAAVGVPAGPAASLGLLSLGGLFLLLWSGRGRWVGLAPVAARVVLWAAADRPDVLIADNGRLFGFRTVAGRVLSAPEGNGFAAESWLEDDGDLAGQAEAHARGGLERRRHRIEADVPGLGRLVYVGSREASEAEAECAAATVLIAPNWELAPAGPCLFVGHERLTRDGALAIWITPDGLAVEGAQSSGRPWTGKAAPGAPRLRLAGG